MTYEEEIKYLKRVVDRCYTGYVTSPIKKEILQHAIEALENQNEKQKEKPETDLSGKCGSCRYLDYADKCSVGYKCTNEIMNKKRKRSIASYKIRTTKACKRYEEAE